MSRYRRRLPGFRVSCVEAACAEYGPLRRYRVQSGKLDSSFEFLRCQVGLLSVPDGAAIEVKTWFEQSTTITGSCRNSREWARYAYSTPHELPASRFPRPYRSCPHFQETASRNYSSLVAHIFLGVFLAAFGLGWRHVLHGSLTRRVSFVFLSTV